MTNFDDLLAEQLKDPRSRKEYDALEQEFALKQAKIDARIAEDIKQKRAFR